MEHPFINDLSDKSLDELQEAITSLNNKLTFAFRTNNGPLIHQIQMVIESYRNQHRKKMDEIFAKQKLNNQINIDKKS
jgi:tRNA(Ile2) C34 agmatinyltransferase TiaS